MKNLATQIQSAGVERRFALDIGSVIAAIRPRGLLHVSADLKHGLERLLKTYGLRIEAFRELYRQCDSASREGVLSECYRDDQGTEKWCEIWYANPEATTVDQEVLFSNPGKFLGYPECCRRAMNGEHALARLYKRYLFEDSDRHWELNRLAALFHNGILMPDFFPCSMSCELARKYVVAFHDVAAEVFSETELEKTVAAMRAPITIIKGDAVQWGEWSLNRERLCVKANGGKKESLAKVSSHLPINSAPSPLLVAFTHLMEGDDKRPPSTLAISAEKGETIELPLKLI
jgi:hypothetical protein